MRISLGALAVAVTAIALAGCGDGSSSSPPPADTGAPASGAPGPGGGLSIEEALATAASGPLLVEGFVVAPEGQPVRLCSGLLESYPPQCGEPSLVVEGLELSSLTGLTSTNDPLLAQTTWSDAAVAILGELSDGVLTVNPTTQ